MTQLIKNYTNSRDLVKQRITELSELRRALLKRGDNAKVSELDLDRRIQVLYEEHGEMQAIISHLTSYNRRRESFGKM
ncbi:MAG: hypothetical protein IJL33_06345 [Ruminococcus sp.]|jgi:hypothetical protein|uniref:Uncharacterized protein n=1 Tax=Ruminococcus flavefaciens TaxID=1265 RepID=A0A1K1P148_RUMFL|nr:hypothetical protein [Ruminococcus flavefaciens]MBQ6035099.1 hypothetical protein [Ruminococcus sp.]SFW41311.1 hypothetical protein SAMN02910280_2426 [Ruminococcus flavefaciens]